MPAPPVSGRLRASTPGDLEAIAHLYFDSYPPGVACATLDEAIDDVRLSFDGGYGEYWYGASPVLERGEGIVGAVMTVRRPIWEDVGDRPFIIEVLVDPGHRRQGVARALATETLRVAERDGEEAVSLRAAADNHSALALYASLGFVEERPRSGREG